MAVLLEGFRVAQNSVVARIGHVKIPRSVNGESGRDIERSRAAVLSRRQVCDLVDLSDNDVGDGTGLQLRSVLKAQDPVVAGVRNVNIGRRYGIVHGNGNGEAEFAALGPIWTVVGEKGRVAGGSQILGVSQDLDRFPEKALSLEAPRQ